MNKNRVLMVTADVVKALNENGITTPTGAEVNLSNFNKMINDGKIPFYHYRKRGAKKWARLFDYEQVEKALLPKSDENVEIEESKDDEEFEKLYQQSIKLEIPFAQFIKAKETYSTYKLKELEVALKKREQIPMDEAKSIIEVMLSNLKSKMYNISSRFKARFPKASQEEVDYIYTEIDNSFGDIYNSIDDV